VQAAAAMPAPATATTVMQSAVGGFANPFARNK
jgi:hypothetical protein